MAVIVLGLFLAVPWVGLWSVIVAFSGHTHFLNLIKEIYIYICGSMSDERYMTMRYSRLFTVFEVIKSRALVKA